MATANTGPVIWAVDPADIKNRPDRPTAVGFARWMAEAHLALQPLHVTRKTSLDDMENRQEAASHYIRDLGVKDFLAPQVVFSTSTSRADSPSALLNEARKNNSPFIMVSSHGRAGVERFVLGSFAESLMLQADRPVLFLSHGEECPDNIGEHKILFATDFSERSRCAFDQFVNVANALAAELVLYHVITFPALAADSVAYMPENWFETQSTWAREQGEKWVNDAERRNVRASFILREGQVGVNVSACILREAEEIKASFIALVSTSSNVRSAVIGSVARDVFRTGRFPVMVYGPESCP